MIALLEKIDEFIIIARDFNTPLSILHLLNLGIQIYNSLQLTLSFYGIMVTPLA